MTDSEDNIRKIAAGKLAEFGMDPPPDMWERIEKQMRRRKRLTLFWYVAMAASVLVLVGVGLTFLMPGNDPETLSDRRTASEQKLKTESPVGSDVLAGKQDNDKTQPSALVTGSGNNSSVKGPGNKFVKSDHTAENQSIDLKLPEATNRVSQDSFIGEISTVAEVSADVIKAADAEVMETPTAPVVTSDVVSQNIPEAITVQPPVSEEPAKGKWQLSMGYSSAAAINMSNEETSLNSTGSNFSYDGLTAEVANETSYFEEIESISHDAPLSFGFIVSHQTGKRWYAETGLLFTRLGYRVKTFEMNHIYQQYGNELYYLGIPLGFRFSILERKRFGVFAAQSVILEKGISSRSFTDTYTQEVLSGSENNKAGIRGIQLSSLTGLGADVKFAANLSVYGQAGLQLFFMNGTQPYNIRSARMAWPSFQLGVRMKLK
ncbi:MAG: outer membrane beta-barrel protein [Bacteroidales bacterium]|nr:outer membrane beta-barrel protein [Bacteroidales bacterium]